MSKPVEVLMEEHRLIEQVLRSLESLAVAAAPSGPAPTATRDRLG